MDVIFPQKKRGGGNRIFGREQILEQSAKKRNKTDNSSFCNTSQRWSVETTVIFKWVFLFEGNFADRNPSSFLPKLCTEPVFGPVICRKIYTNAKKKIPVTHPLGVCTDQYYVTNVCTKKNFSIFLPHIPALAFFSFFFSLFYFTYLHPRGCTLSTSLLKRLDR